MEKSTKLIIAAVGLGGLGYFLYKRGLFAKTTTTEVAKDVKKVDDVVKDIVKEVIDTGKKTAVELTKDCVQVGYDCTNTTYNTIKIPIDADCREYQPAMPQCAPPRGGEDESFIKIYEPIGFRDNTLTDPYMGRDMINARFNQYLV
jgi:hypothetical protein